MAKSHRVEPSYPTAHLWLALYLAAVERMDEALSEIRLALDLTRCRES
jgi:hypothetical protein